MIDSREAHGRIAGLPMYDWPEVAGDVDDLWRAIAAECRRRDVEVPDALTRTEHVVTLWRDPTMILGQVCSLNPVRDGLGETEVLGTIVYDPPEGLPHSEPGSYYSVIVARADDPRAASGGSSTSTDPSLATPEHLDAFAGATVAANGTDSQSGYWSLGHCVRELDEPLFGRVLFTGAHRDSVRAVADGRADVAAIDVHSWRLALEHEPEAAQRLTVIGTTAPTPGVVCVVAWELAVHREALDASIGAAIDGLRGSDTLRRLHVSGYRPRRMEEFQIVADRVEVAAARPWHR